MLNDLTTALAQAIAAATGLDATAVAKGIVTPKQREHGDLSFACFPLAKAWGLPPPQCAIKLATELKLPSGVTEAIPTGPYLNFRVARGGLSQQVISSILKAGFDVGKQPAKSETVVVEYSSPNIAKTFHVGHLRTTLIGHSLVQIYKHLGYKVVGVNHLGDWGTQFGFVYAGCELWGRPQNPTVEALVELYRRASALRKAQDKKQVPPEDADKPDVNQMARDYFIRLEGKDPAAREFWQWCLDISMDYFLAMYKRLGIEFTHHTGESFYEDMVPKVEEDVRASGILEDSEGALGVNLGKELGFARIFAPDGRSLYITRDLAAAMYRHKTFGAKEILYVVAAQQSLHFKQLIEILRRMKHPVADSMVHVSFGFVPGMSTREGGAISLKDYIDEAHARALKAYRNEVSKRPEGVDEEKVAEAVAIGATYFYFLNHVNVKDFNFSWDEALSFQGDTGPYLQYALARIYGIELKAKEAGIALGAEFDATVLDEPSAHELVLLLSKFSETVQKAATEHEPFCITQYLLSLAKAFSKAYLAHKVLGAAPHEAQARLALFSAVKNVLQTGLRLVGVPALERM